MNDYKILQGDCLERLKELPDESVDAIVTDPPYELGFMGKKWDNTGIAYNVDLWKECLRVLKPGGHLLAFGGTRTYHRMAVAIEDAGLEVRDMLEWIYNTGFPKSLNIGKAVDKVCGETGRELKFVEWFRTTGLKQKETNEIIGKSDVGSHYLRKDQPAIPTAELWVKLRPHIKIEIPEWVDKLVERIEREREIIGKTNTNLTIYQRIGQDNISGEINITKGNSEREGFGTALKPAHEPIVMARKPLSEKTIVANVLKHGTGGLDIDGCRIPCVTEKDLKEAQSSRPSLADKGTNQCAMGALDRSDRSNITGRFPANILVTDVNCNCI